MIESFNKFYVSLIRKDSFIQNIGMISSGKVVVILISFLFIPILSRIYDPIAYGNFSLFSSIITLSTISLGLGFPTAFVVIKSKAVFHNLFFFILFLLVGASILIGIVVGIIHLYNPVEQLFLLLPIGVLIGGLITYFSNWNVREGAFKLAAFLEGSGNLLIRLVNLGFGLLLNAPSNGLIYGDLIGKLYATTINLNNFIKQEWLMLRQNISWVRMKSAIVEYRNYPKYIFPNQLIGQFGGHLPIYIITLLSGKSLLGLFSMSISLLNVPVQLISNGISSVFYKKATELHDESPEILSQFTSKLYKSLFLVLVIPFSILTVFGEELLTFFLGKQWEISGQFVSYMSVYFYLYLVIGPTQSIFLVLQQERTILFLNILQIAGSALSLLLGFLVYESPVVAILLFSIGSTIYYLIFGFMITRALKISFIKNLLVYFIAFIFMAVSLYLIKIFIL